MTEDDEAGTDYLTLASRFKDLGNAAFQRGDNDEAIAQYSKAIDLNPDDHLLYSNRSAAHMKASNISKALKDAEKCLELNPEFAKGYNRIGVAQQALKRYDLALASFTKGLQLEPTNVALTSALRSCEEQMAVEREARFAKATMERAQEDARIQAADDAKKKAQSSASDLPTMATAGNSENEDTLLATNSKDIDVASASSSTKKTAFDAEDCVLTSFFSSIGESNAVTNARGSGDVSAVAETSRGNFKGDFHEKYANQDLGSGLEQHNRLLQTNHEFRNLNPYYVLQLDTDATSEDIKQRYRKLSSKVHPDKNRDIPNARDSFEIVKKAYERLVDEEQRAILVHSIDVVREEARRAYKANASKIGNAGATKSIGLAGGSSLGILACSSVEEAEVKAVMKYFADAEMARHRSENLQRSYNVREKMKAQEEVDKLKLESELDKSWSEKDRRDKRVANWRDFSAPPAKRKHT